MDEYSFSFVLEGAEDLTEEFAERIYGVADDSSLGRQGGVTRLSFDREASSLIEAISTAIRDAESVDGILVERLEPEDLVAASEIARRIGQSRESVRLYIKGERGPGGFPGPARGLDSPSPLYRWDDVAEWVAKNLGPEHLESSIREAKVVEAFNAALELRRLAPDSASSILDSVLGARKPQTS